MSYIAHVTDSMFLVRFGGPSVSRENLYHRVVNVPFCRVLAGIILAPANELVTLLRIPM